MIENDRAVEERVAAVIADVHGVAPDVQEGAGGQPEAIGVRSVGQESVQGGAAENASAWGGSVVETLSRVLRKTVYSSFHRDQNL